MHRCGNTLRGGRGRNAYSDSYGTREDRTGKTTHRYVSADNSLGKCLVLILNTPPMLQDIQLVAERRARLLDLAERSQANVG